ncbi:MAG: DUF4340 domain-containing protein, partial [Verrucomicrobiales bacterium]
MGKKQVLALLVVLAVVGVIAAAVKMSRSSGVKASTKGIGEKVFPEFPINDIAAIRFSSAEGGLDLVRTPESIWVLQQRDDYPADFSRVSGLLKEFWNLKTVQHVEAGPSQFGRLELVSPGEGEAGEGEGTLVDFFTAGDDPVNSVLLGKEFLRASDTPNPFGGPGGVPAARYIRAGNSEDVWLVAEIFSSVDLDPADWLSKDFFKVEKLRSIERISAQKKEDWKLARESEEAEWKLLFLRPDEELDDSKISSQKNAFSNPRFDDIVTGEGAIGKDATKFVLETFDGFTYSLELSDELEERKHQLSVKLEAKLPSKRKPEEEESEEDKKQADEAFAAELERLESKLEKEKALEGHVFLVPNFVASPLLKKRSEILKSEEDAAGAPADFGGATPPIPYGLGPAAGTGGGVPMPASVPAAATVLPDAPKAPRATAGTEPIEIKFPANKDAPG